MLVAPRFSRVLAFEIYRVVFVGTRLSFGSSIAVAETIDSFEMRAIAGGRMMESFILWCSFVA
jgi:hypothetical protein